MSSNAYLSSYVPATRRVAEPHFEGKAHVPLFWLAMFEPRDHVAQLSYQFDWMTAPSVEASCLTAAASAATATFGRRLPALRRFCGPAHDALLDRFTLVVRDKLGPSVLVRLDGLAGMDEAGRFDTQLAEALDAIGCLDTGAGSPSDHAALRGITSLDHDWRDGTYADAILCGFWPDSYVAPANARWEARVAWQPRGAFRRYEASATFAPDQLVEHPTFGDGLVVRVVDPGKVEILFAAGARTLAHRRVVT